MENQHKMITGYRDLTPADIDLMNRIKATGVALEVLVEDLRGRAETDKRWINIGATDLQTGLMALTRSVAKPATF